MIETIYLGLVISNMGYGFYKYGFCDFVDKSAENMFLNVFLGTDIFYIFT